MIMPAGAFSRNQDNPAIGKFYLSFGGAMAWAFRARIADRCAALASDARYDADETTKATQRVAFALVFLKFDHGAAAGRLIGREDFDAGNIDKDRQFDHLTNDLGNVFRLDRAIAIVKHGLRLIVGD